MTASRSTTSTAQSIIAILCFTQILCCICGCQGSSSNGVSDYGSGMDEKTHSREYGWLDDADDFPPKSFEQLADVDERTFGALRSAASDKVEITAPQGENRINILAWNVESDGNDPTVIAEQLKGMKGYHIFALSEVRGRASADKYIAAVKQIWGKAKGLLSKTGREDALLFIFDPSVFELVKVEELNDLNPQMKYRSPHAMTLKHNNTQQVFIVMNNHLARGNEDNRNLQAIGLREWARRQTLPIVAVGDYNFDYVFQTKKGNREFTEFMRDGIWQWVKPESLVDSNWYDGNDDGVDDYAGSILDFAFVAQSAKDWSATCRVHQWPGDFPDDKFTSDHRPLGLSVQLSVSIE